MKKREIVILLIGVLGGAIIASSVFLIIQKSYIKNITIDNNKQIIIDTLTIDSINTVYITNDTSGIDSLFTDSLISDTLILIDTTVIIQQHSDSLTNYDEVYKDTKLYSLYAKIINVDNSLNNDLSLDSLLTNNTYASSGDEYIIEFWNSPINYRGYQLVNHRLAVFGLLNPENTRLFYYNSQYYLENNDKYYIIQQLDDFQRFLELDNEGIINLFKNI